MPLRPTPGRLSPAQSALITPKFNIRAPSYFVAVGHRRCWRCSAEIEVSALGVGPPFSQLVGKVWQAGSSLAMLSYVEAVSPDVSEQISHLAPRYLRDESHWHQRPYWMNHCPHCNAKVGDYETVDALDAPFNTATLEVHKLAISVVSCAFEASAALNPCQQDHARAINGVQATRRQPK